MITASKIIIVLIIFYTIGVVLLDRYNKRKVTYYTLESSDGYRYEMAYATRQLAIEGAKEIAYSGTAYVHTVGGGRKMAFVW